jgi:hypothetical protein
MSDILAVQEDKSLSNIDENKSEEDSALMSSTCSTKKRACWNDTPKATT